MIKKGLSVLAASFLLAGLAACNNNGDNAFDNDQNFNTLGNDDRGIFTDRDTDIDTLTNRDGMLFNRTEERSEPSNLRPYRYSTNQYGAIHQDGANNESISNLKTTLSSNKYPHTRAILIQDAKFKFVKVNPNQAGRGQANFQWGTGKWGAQPQRGQQGTAPAPKQQPDQQQQAPAPQPQAPAQQPQAQPPAAQPQPEQQQPQAQPETGTTAPADQSISQAARKVIELTNAERRKNGLPDLKADTQLSGVAQKKSEDMRKNNYFSHTSPTYGSPFDMMRDHGVSYKTAGENIAQGQQTPEQVVQAWMNSEGHRKNILSRDFTHIGVGYDANGHHWTQMFVGR